MRKLSSGFALVFLLHLGVSAPQKAVDAKQPSMPPQGAKTRKSVAAIATPQAIGAGIVQFFGRGKTGKELMEEKAKKSVPAAKTAVPTKTTSRLKKANLTPGYVPPPPGPRASVPQVRQEIEKIFELNKKIKSVQSGRSVQLQRVQEQARIHQKILDELEASQKQSEGQKASAKSALLAQEKLRIIHEETQRNTKTINDLNEAPAETAPDAATKVKTAAS